MAKGCEALYLNALDIWDSAMLCYVIKLKLNYVSQYDPFAHCP